MLTSGDPEALLRAFVNGLGTEPGAEAIVAAIVGMARALDLAVVAEGVETAEQLSELNRLGCDCAQGYLFARPLPPEEITELLAAADETATLLPEQPTPGPSEGPIPCDLLAGGTEQG